jgi:hypothetical protein
MTIGLLAGCGAGCQVGLQNREPDEHKGHCCRVTEASEEGSTPAGGAASATGEQGIRISSWDL